MRIHGWYGRTASLWHADVLAIDPVNLRTLGEFEERESDRHGSDVYDRHARRSPPAAGVIVTAASFGARVDAGSHEVLARGSERDAAPVSLQREEQLGEEPER